MKNTKLIKPKTKKVYKNKKLNNANFGTYNLNDYQVFLHLISQIGGIDVAGNYLQPEQLEREHTITAKEFSQTFNLDLTGAYKVLQRAGKRMANTAITIEKPELFEIWDIPVCTSKYNYKEGSLTVRFTEEIMPYLTQVKKKFVLYNLKEVANFGSLYSTRLYELIQEFKDTGFLIKSIAQLREVFAVGKKFEKYNDLKRKTFGHAVEEINSQYEIDLRFEEIKEGRKVVAIRFEFEPTFTRKVIDPHTGKERNIYIKPKKREVTPEQIREKEIAKFWRDVDRQYKKIANENLKKYGNERGIDIDAAYGVQESWENYQRYLKELEQRGIHPDQQELGL
jgi:plasmid replication initiation protein